MLKESFNVVSNFTNKNPKISEYRPKILTKRPLHMGKNKQKSKQFILY
jgi:hypothetical protein